ncbi:MAG: porin [Sulfuricella sp.]|nr:porin [Sulfuricella sp.]
MNKKLLAFAVATAFAAPMVANADSGNVTLSGKVAASLSQVGGTGGAGNNNTHQVNNENSNINLAGSEDLGGGMKAFFSLTYTLPLANAGTFSGQNQIAGLEGAFGKVFMGAFDNPLKVMGRGVDFFGDQTAGDSRTLTGRGAVEARANDVVAYISPSFSGAQLVLAHSNNPLTAVAAGCATINPAATGCATPADGDTSMNIIKLAYANGPLNLALGYHRVDSQYIFNDAGKETAWRLTGAYTAGALKVAGTYQKVNHAYNAADKAAGADNKVWGLGASYAIGATTVKAQYYKLTDDVSDAGANMFALGADYSLSKRTTLQAAYSRVGNDKGVAYGNSMVGGADTYAIATGANPNRFALGLKHTF